MFYLAGVALTPWHQCLPLAFSCKNPTIPSKCFGLKFISFQEMCKMQGFRLTFILMKQTFHLLISSHFFLNLISSFFFTVCSCKLLSLHGLWSACLLVCVRKTCICTKRRRRKKGRTLEDFFKKQKRKKPPTTTTTPPTVHC